MRQALIVNASLLKRAEWIGVRDHAWFLSKQTIARLDIKQKDINLH